MALVVIVDEPQKLDHGVEDDMRRWWGHACKKYERDGVTFFDVAGSKRFKLYEGVKRFASYGVKARVGRMTIDRSWSA